MTDVHAPTHVDEAEADEVVVVAVVLVVVEVLIPVVEVELVLAVEALQAVVVVPAHAGREYTLNAHEPPQVCVESPPHLLEQDEPLITFVESSVLPQKH